MTTAATARFRRRRPNQRRARQTVDAILEAAIRVLKREGFGAITTNRIAEVAGVSIGSVYQYFPDKRAIFVALHQRHVEEMDRLVGIKLVEHANSSLEGLVCGLVEAVVEAHATDPELHELLLTQVPHRVDGTQGFAMRLHGAFRLAIASKHRDLKRHRDLDKIVFITANMVEALSHAAALQRPDNLSRAEVKEEIVRAVMAYLRA
jgi:AcrR family transcriptional regulator